jgi:hypothetical protein
LATATEENGSVKIKLVTRIEINSVTLVNIAEGYGYCFGNAVISSARKSSVLLVIFAMVMPGVRGVDEVRCYR